MSIARQFADAPAATPKVVNAAHVVNHQTEAPANSAHVRNLRGPYCWRSS